MIRGHAILLTLCLVAPATAGAQSPAPQGQAPAAGTPPPALAAAPSAIEPQGYTYEPEGRRDPFISLVRRGTDSPGSQPGVRPAGIGGLTTDEVSLRGTLEGREGYVAMLQGTDGRTYIVRAGDALLDGTIRTITPDAMVILQRVNDPLSLDTEREVRIELRPTEEAN
jgi:type IV pilus assembly protein PilP